VLGKAVKRELSSVPAFSRSAISIGIVWHQDWTRGIPTLTVINVCKEWRDKRPNS
jgi:hypothetical protein